MPRFTANLSFLFQDEPFLDRFAAAADQGFQAVEFMFPSDFAAAAVASAAQSAGVQVALFNTPAGDFASGERGLTALPERRREFRAAIARSLEYAAAFNCPRIHVMAGVMPPGAERRAMEACYMDNLAWAAEQASAQGRILLIEPINRRDIPGFFLSDFDFAEKVITDIGAPNLRLQFDTYHAQIIHGDLSRRIERQMPWIGHVQIANPPDRREPGKGEIDYRYILGLFDRLGYDGWIGCEYRPEGSTIDSLGWIRDYGVAPPKR
ncbi:MAG: 2-oxo-tetronate isomerase [Ferrovibrio sp.]